MCPEKNMMVETLFTVFSDLSARYENASDSDAAAIAASMAAIYDAVKGSLSNPYSVGS